MNKISADEVRKVNNELRDTEARYYDILHREILDFYEKSKTRRDLRKLPR